MKYKFTTEEQKLINEIEKDDWKSSKNIISISKKLKDAAKTSLLKDKRMNIRIAGRDIELLKTKALEEGVPYQTLVSSILHKFVTGKLKETR